MSFDCDHEGARPSLFVTHRVRVRVFRGNVQMATYHRTNRSHPIWGAVRDARYGVATISRLLKIIGLFCKRVLQKRPIFSKETYNLKEPTSRSHPIVCGHVAHMCMSHVTHMNESQLTIAPSRCTHWHRQVGTNSHNITMAVCHTSQSSLQKIFG